MNGKLLSGFRGNAASIGSMAVSMAASKAQASDADAPATPQQLLNKASLRDLEKLLNKHGHQIETLHGYQELTGDVLALFDQWSDEASLALAGAIVNAHAVLDSEYIVIDGTLPAAQLASLIKKVELALARYDLTGLERPQFSQGLIGYEARALGGAFLPVYAQFAPDRDVFLKMMNRNRAIDQSILQHKKVTK